MEKSIPNTIGEPPTTYMERYKMDWSILESFYEELIKNDVYVQPDEGGRTKISKSIISSAPISELKTVLDVGCGLGYAQELFEGMEYVGITASQKEHEIATGLGRSVFLMDYNFIRFDRNFDLVFSSHSLEHSPFPVLTLMEWHRVGSHLLLIVPNPEHYGYIGKNHYSVSESQQIRWWLRRAGWKVLWNKSTNTDLAYFAKREARIGSEGWTELSTEIYEADRDDTICES